MKKTTMNLALSAALLAMASAACADGAFDGGYAGVKAGANRSSITTSSTSSAATYGVEGGYGWDAGSGVVGIFGFYDFNQSSSHTTQPNGSSDFGSDVYGLGLKAGLPFGNLMPYLKVAYSETQGRKGASGRGDGVYGGVGLEYKLAPNWSVAGEYTYTNPTTNIVGPGATVNSYKNENFTLGLNYYFKAPPAPAPAPAVVEAPQPEPEKVAPPPPAEPKWKTVVTEKPIRIDGANFAFDSDKLKPAAETNLNQILAVAKEYPELDFDVSGHTDNIGPLRHNQGLSERRAAAVKNWLVKNGVAADRITTAGYADTKPVASNATREGRAANRRVEVAYVLRKETKVRVQ
jgi:OOP family OmpA-OmpF porin